MVLGSWGNTDLAACRRVIHRALDAGINLVDTADMYAAGENEEMVGAALQGRRDAVVLCNDPSTSEPVISTPTAPPPMMASTGTGSVRESLMVASLNPTCGPSE